MLGDLVVQEDVRRAARRHRDRRRHERRLGRREVRPADGDVAAAHEAVDEEGEPVRVGHAVRVGVGHDLAGRRVDRHQRPVAHVLVGEVGDPLVHELASNLLQVVVERRRDLVAAGANVELGILRAECLEDLRRLGPHAVGEVWLEERGRDAARLHVEPGRRERLVVLRLGDVPVAQHALEHEVAPLERRARRCLAARLARRVLVRVIEARRLR